jgi:hypothetical protein
MDFAPVGPVNVSFDTPRNDRGIAAVTAGVFDQVGDEQLRAHHQTLHDDSCAD